MQRSRLTWILGVVSVIFNVLDSLTTHIALSMGMTEGNPIVRYFISENMLLLFDIVKLVGISYIVLPFRYNPVNYFLLKDKTKNKVENKNTSIQKFGIFILFFTALYFILTVINNLTRIFGY